MKAVLLSGAVFMTLFVLSPSLMAQTKIESKLDTAKTEFCERCHGVKGFTDNANMPRLAGQNRGYLVRQLKNFRKGIRKSAPMRQVTLSLSDEDIEALATYFSSIAISLND